MAEPDELLIWSAGNDAGGDEPSVIVKPDVVVLSIGRLTGADATPGVCAVPSSTHKLVFLAFVI